MCLYRADFHILFVSFFRVCYRFHSCFNEKEQKKNFLFVVLFFSCVSAFLFLSHSIPVYLSFTLRHIDTSSKSHNLLVNNGNILLYWEEWVQYVFMFSFLFYVHSLFHWFIEHHRKKGSLSITTNAFIHYHINNNNNNSHFKSSITIQQITAF